MKRSFQAQRGDLSLRHFGLNSLAKNFLNVHIPTETQHQAIAEVQPGGIVCALEF